MPIKKSSRTEIMNRILAQGPVLVGQRMRRIRQQKEMSLRDISEISGVSKNTVLRAEQGLPTQLDSLIAICKAMKIPVNDLLTDEVTDQSHVVVHRRDQDAWYDMNDFTNLVDSRRLSDEDRLALAKNDEGITAFNLIWARSQDGRFNPNLVELHHPTPRRSHHGEEFVFVLQGEVRVVFSNREVILGAYESCYFWAGEMHHYEPVGEIRPVKILSIVLDPFPTITRELSKIDDRDLEAVFEKAKLK
jgi:transcriptional regulator with XRE-family HTH domain